jgi:hypothetical protein
MTLCAMLFAPMALGWVLAGIFSHAMRFQRFFITHRAAFALAISIAQSRHGQSGNNSNNKNFR